VPRGIVAWFLAIVFCVFGALAAVIIDYGKLRNVAHDYERIRAENHSIRSEAAAIISRLESVQSALNRMDNFSTQIREMAKPDASCKGPRCKTIQSKPSSTKSQGYNVPAKPDSYQGRLAQFSNVGPLSKEDYLLSRGLKAKALNTDPSVNFGNLEFREAFERLLQVGMRSESQAKALERLLGDVKDYQKKIATTPTLAPAIGYVSSNFGDRESPFSGKETMHWGMDIAAPVGTTVYVAAAGRVLSARHVDDYGKVIDVDHGNGIVTRYAHLNRMLVKPGDKVVKGDVIGEVGNTGRSTGPHLHYEVEVNGRRVNPRRFIHEW
jgi:murein DD-endopeptidase MepM/ murein hydrolase activator NlpD